jgi:DNA-binding transcriptional LysR family regulator
MEPRYLRQLAEIVDLGSLSLAAKSLNVTQPTLSRNIKSLEASIGAPVLHRGRYGVTPTAIGATLAREGRSIRDALRQADIDLGHWKGGFAGRLKLGVGTMLAHSLMSRLLVLQGNSRWKIALRIDVEGPDRLIDRVRSGDLDVAVVQIDPYFPKEGLEQIALFDDRRAYYSGARHPLAKKRPVTDRDISRAKHVTVGAFAEGRAHRFEQSASDSAGPRIELSGDVSIALHLLATGTYIAALPEFVMSHLCDERQFVRLAYHGEMPSRTLSIWHREDMSGHRLIKEFSRRFSDYVTTLRARDAGQKPTRTPAPARGSTAVARR